MRGVHPRGRRLIDSNSMLAAAALVLVGGLLAGPSRPLSDSLVLAGFGVLLPSVALGWLGLRAATNTPLRTQDTHR